LRAPGNAVCTRCHLPSRYDSESHHHHSAGSKAAACTSCHMPQRVYMVVDERADHSIRVPRPDLSVAIGTPNACNQCHNDQTAEWAAEIIGRWRGAEAAPSAHFGETLHAARGGAADATDRLLALAADREQPGIARATALEHLYNQARPQDRLTLQRLLADDDALVRRAAAGALEQSDLALRAELLLPVLEDPARTVRIEAARLLAPLLQYDLPQPTQSRLMAVLKEYTHAQAVNADRPESHLNLGNLALALGNLRAAEEAYRTALRLQPGFAPAYVNLADLFRQQNREDQAEALLRKGLANVPDAPDVHHALGLLLVRDQRLDEALVALRQATELAVDQPRYAYVYALALKEKGEPEKAITTLETTRRSHPGDREVLSALTTLYLEQGDREAARQAVEDLKVRYPHDPEVKSLWEQVTETSERSGSAQ
jgi:tetratricopeptide (TPR) repeat protein